MPGNGFALTIGVGREIHVASGPHGGTQLFDDLALPFNSEIFGNETVVDIDAQRALWKITYVSHRGFYGITPREKLLDRTCFGRRLYDDEWPRQAYLPISPIDAGAYPPEKNALTIAPWSRGCRGTSAQ